MTTGEFRGYMEVVGLFWRTLTQGCFPFLPGQKQFPKFDYVSANEDQEDFPNGLGTGPSHVHVTISRYLLPGLCREGSLNKWSYGSATNCLIPPLRCYLHLEKTRCKPSDVSDGGFPQNPSRCLSLCLRSTFWTPPRCMDAAHRWRLTHINQRLFFSQSGDGSPEPRWGSTSTPKRLRHLPPDGRPGTPRWHGCQLQSAYGPHQGLGGSHQCTVHVGSTLPAQLAVLLPPVVRLAGLHRRPCGVLPVQPVRTK